MPWVSRSWRCEDKTRCWLDKRIECLRASQVCWGSSDGNDVVSIIKGLTVLRDGRIEEILVNRTRRKFSNPASRLSFY